MSTAAHSDVLVLGGGLIGTATAFFLRHAHGKSVTLLERELVGRQASGTNFGGVRRQGRTPQQMPIAHRALRTWGRVRELLGEDLEFRPYGHLRICHSPERADMMAEYARDIRHAGLDLQLLTREQLRERLGIFSDEIVMGSLSPHDGHANPRIAGPAFARAARRLGAQVVEHAEVAHVERGGDGFRVEATDGRQWRGDQLMVCCGAWSGRLSAQFGEPAPLEFRAPSMAVTEPLPYRAGPFIAMNSGLIDEVMYFRQIERGNIVIGGGRRAEVDLDRARAYVHPDNILRQFRELRRFVPAFARVQLIRVWSGVESYTPDSRPIMGRSARVEGLHYAFGFCGEGFAIGPGVGEVMAEAIAGGRTDLDLSPYDIARFAAQAPAAESSAAPRPTTP